MNGFAFPTGIDKGKAAKVVWSRETRKKTTRNAIKYNNISEKKKKSEYIPASRFICSHRTQKVFQLLSDSTAYRCMPYVVCVCVCLPLHCIASDSLIKSQTEQKRIHRRRCHILSHLKSIYTYVRKLFWSFHAISYQMILHRHIPLHVL